MKKDAKLAKFGVQVEGIDISEELNKQIGSEIMEVVLRNIAKLDLSKDGDQGPYSPRRSVVYARIFQQILVRW